MGGWPRQPLCLLRKGWKNEQSRLGHDNELLPWYNTFDELEASAIGQTWEIP